MVERAPANAEEVFAAAQAKTVPVAVDPAVVVPVGQMGAVAAVAATDPTVPEYPGAIPLQTTVVRGVATKVEPADVEPA